MIAELYSLPPIVESEPLTHHRFLNRAIKEAEASTFLKFRVGAVIFKGNRLISTGRNWGNKWNSSVPAHFKKWPTSIHAEVDALINARQDVAGYSILVVRIGQSGQLLLAQPCVHCEAYLHHCGIKKVYFSTNDGTIDHYRIN